MSSKPTLFIMCGLPFSGKTYISREIAKQLGFKRVSYDELWVEKTSATGSSVPYDVLMPQAQELLSQYLVNGHSVIFDTLNDTVGNRSTLRQLADKVGANSIILYLNIPQETLHARQQENEQNKSRHSVPSDKLSEAYARFELPIGEANVIEYRPEFDLREWIGGLAPGN